MSNNPQARPLLLDPRSVPIIGSEGHWPALPQARLQGAGLRAWLQATRDRPAAIPGDVTQPTEREREPAPASVLVPLVQRAQGLQVLLTRRTDHLRNHAGQVSFPGGRREVADADEVATALREAEEEIGLRPEHLEVIATLPNYTTVTRFVVTPVLALVSPDHQLRLDPTEVAEAFEVPLAFLMDPANHRRHRFELDGLQREFLSMPWTDGAGREHFIWGATAAMLRNLYHRLGDR